MFRVLILLLAAALLVAVGGAPSAAQALDTRVRIVTTDFVLAGKFRRLAEWGAPLGVAVDATYVEKAGGAPQDWISGADLVIVDAPRGGDLAAVKARLGDVLASGSGAWIQVGGGPPAFGGLPPDQARRLIAYYAAGGEANLRALLSFAAALKHGASLEGFPAPQALAKVGAYHPDAGAAFASTGAYAQWSAARYPATAPKIAFAITEQSLSSAQTAIIDALIRSAEARGFAPMAFWFDASDPQGLTKALTPFGPDVLVNLQHMQNGEARRREFEALGVPVLQTITYRGGDAAAWRASTSGVDAMSAAVMLAGPEIQGMTDPVVIGAVENGDPMPMPAQIEALTAKAARLVALKRKPAGDKRIVLMFWNQPGGERNISASNLNVPRSLEVLLPALAAAGYAAPAVSEAALTPKLQALLAGYYRPETLSDLRRDGLAVELPVARYRAWLDTLPAEVRRDLAGRWGEPESHWAVRPGADGRPAFVIPALALGNLTLMPQAPRADRPGEAYHDLKSVPGHLYLATYLYMRDVARADALIHFGTHGTQEWTPGKDRGLSVEDYPFLTLGDVPVFYPYIQDNVAEAMQARRRGRAVTISHQTPPFAPSGLYDELRDLHQLVHEYAQLEEGPVRRQTEQQLVRMADRAGLVADLGYTPALAKAGFPEFLGRLHDHLHLLAQAATPLGLHTFGVAAAPELRVATVMQQLGADYYRALGLDPKEVFAEDFTALRRSEPYVRLAHYLIEGAPVEQEPDPKLRAMFERALELDGNLAQPGETEALLMGLAGGFVRPGPGGDPVRNPEVPSGRNLFAFEPDKFPTPSAYEAGKVAFDKLLASYRAEHQGKPPAKLAFSLWSSETIRTLGVVESQALYALGLKPIWDRAGRVTAMQAIPLAELGRPRVDVVFQVTSVYRDQFDGFMRVLAAAINNLASEPAGTLAANVAQTARSLQASGLPEAEARRLAALRLFSNAPGEYGSGLPDATLDTESWESEADLAKVFLSRMGYAYGVDDWGVRTDRSDLFAAQLKGVDAAVLSRSSNLNGLLATDHPFEYLGGLSLAIRQVSGRSPDLYVTDMRGGEPKVGTAAGFLAAELRSRYLNPQWIKSMQAEGYAGTLAVVDLVDNVFGWQVADPKMIRPDQWRDLAETYVLDKRKLGLNAWFETANPAAQAQVIDRMLEAVRKDYWKPDQQLLRRLVERRMALARKDAPAPGEKAGAFAARLAAGFGLTPRPSAAAASPAAAAAAAGSPPTPAPPKIKGRVMAKVAPPPPPAPAQVGWLALLLAAVMGAGAAHRRAQNQRLMLLES